MNKTKHNSTIYNAIQDMEDVPEIPLYTLVIATLTYVCIFVIGSFGNISTIAVVYSFRSMRTRMSYLFTNLSVADLLVYFICLPSAAVDLYSRSEWFFGEFLCILVPFLENVVTITSALTVVTISYLRHLGIKDPINYNYRVENMRTWAILLFIWVTAIVISLPLAMMTIYLDSTLLDGTPIKVCLTPIDREWKKIYLIINTAFFLLILGALMVLFLKMSSKLKKHSTFIQRASYTSTNSSTRDRRRVTIALFTIIVSFVVCLLPYRLFALWVVFTKPSNLEKLGFESYMNLISFSRALTYLNGAVNPVLYSGMSASYRHIVLKYVKRAFQNTRTTSRHRNLGQRRKMGIVKNHREIRQVKVCGRPFVGQGHE